MVLSFIFHGMETDYSSGYQFFHLKGFKNTFCETKTKGSIVVLYGNNIFYFIL